MLKVLKLDPFVVIQGTSSDDYDNHNGIRVDKLDFYKLIVFVCLNMAREEQYDALFHILLVHFYHLLHYQYHNFNIVSAGSGSGDHVLYSHVNDVVESLRNYYQPLL